MNGDVKLRRPQYGCLQSGTGRKRDAIAFSGVRTMRQALQLRNCAWSGVLCDEMLESYLDF
jgi:hypothetical protein